MNELLLAKSESALQNFHLFATFSHINENEVFGLA